MKLLITLCLSLFLGASVVSCQNRRHSVDVALQAIVNSDSTLLVDVRTSDEFAVGHVEGSVNIPVDVIENNLDKFEGKKHIVVFCRSGKRAANAKEILAKNGFSNVLNGSTWGNIDNLRKAKSNETQDESQTAN